MPSFVHAGFVREVAVQTHRLRGMATHKVVGHAREKGVQGVAEEDMQGNEMADLVANEGRSQHPSMDLNVMKWVDYVDDKLNKKASRPIPWRWWRKK